MDHRCLCGHFKGMHNKAKGPLWLPNGCRGMNCQCRFYRYRSHVAKLAPEARLSFWTKVRAAVGL
jgi:hypothetical protein